MVSDCGFTVPRTHWRYGLCSSCRERTLISNCCRWCGEIFCPLHLEEHENKCPWRYGRTNNSIGLQGVVKV